MSIENYLHELETEKITYVKEAHAQAFLDYIKQNNFDDLNISKVETQYGIEYIFEKMN